jgi:hypothetical protein
MGRDPGLRKLNDLALFCVLMNHRSKPLVRVRETTGNGRSAVPIQEARLTTQKFS